MYAFLQQKCKNDLAMLLKKEQSRERVRERPEVIRGCASDCTLLDEFDQGLAVASARHQEALVFRQWQQRCHKDL